MEDIIRAKIKDLCKTGSKSTCLTHIGLKMITGQKVGTDLPVLTQIPGFADSKAIFGVVCVVTGDVYTVWGGFPDRDFIGNLLDDNIEDLLVPLLERYQDDGPDCPDPLECRPDVNGRGCE